MYTQTYSDGFLLYSLVVLSWCSFVTLPAFSISHSVFTCDVSLLILSYMMLSFLPIVTPLMEFSSWSVLVHHSLDTHNIFNQYRIWRGKSNIIWCHDKVWSSLCILYIKAWPYCLVIKMSPCLAACHGVVLDPLRLGFSWVKWNDCVAHKPLKLSPPQTPW